VICRAVAAVNWCFDQLLFDTHTRIPPVYTQSDLDIGKLGTTICLLTARLSSHHGLEATIYSLVEYQ
jgi:hypothetical protein